MSLVVTAQCSIKAPRERVWDVLVDFPAYAEWNPLIRSIRTDLELGDPVDMQIDLGRGLFHQREFVRRIEPQREIAWGMSWRLGFLCHALRVQELREGPDGETIYWTRDDIEGLLSPLVRLIHGPMLHERFAQMAESLKAECERREKLRGGGIAA